MERMEMPEQTGKQYENINDLIKDISDFQEKNKQLLNTYNDESENIPVLRIYGKVLAKFRNNDNGKEFWDLVDSQKPTAFVSASIFQINDKKISLNIYDWSKHERGKKITPIYWFDIDDKTIKSYKVKPAVKKLLS